MLVISSTKRDDWVENKLFVRAVQADAKRWAEWRRCSEHRPVTMWCPAVDLLTAVSGFWWSVWSVESAVMSRRRRLPRTPAVEGRKEMFYLMMHSTAFYLWLYGVRRKEGNVIFNDALNTFYLRLYRRQDIWLRTILIVRKETRCHYMGCYFRLTARVLLYAQSHRQDNTYHGLCYTSRGALAGIRNSSMGPPWRISPTPIASWLNTLTTELHLAPLAVEKQKQINCICWIISKK